MDINMPEMDGVEATRRIRSLGTPEAKRVPIISISANTNSDEIQNYLAAGMTDHIGKPIDYDDVIRKIKKHISH
jgi:CheY-like chemotaxis protein